MKKLLKKQSAFTLIELLVVIAPNITSAVAQKLSYSCRNSSSGRVDRNGPGLLAS